jgi:hypothetical protein
LSYNERKERLTHVTGWEEEIHYVRLALVVGNIMIAVAKRAWPVVRRLEFVLLQVGRVAQAAEVYTLASQDIGEDKMVVLTDCMPVRYVVHCVAQRVGKQAAG